MRPIGRDPAKLARLGGDPHAVPAWDAAHLADALQGCAAVVSCAGPFLEAGRPVVEAVLALGLPYCDSTGEREFMRWVFEQDAEARRSGALLVPAFGFDYVPGDLGAALAARGLGPLRRVDVIYASRSLATSRGTRRTVAAGQASGIVGMEARSVEVPWGRVRALSIAGGEAVTVPRHLEVDEVQTFLAMKVPPALIAAAGAAARLPVVGGLLRSAFERGPAGPSGADLEAQFACLVEVEARAGERRAVLAEGRGPYLFTGEALAELSMRMARGKVDATGARAPAELVEPEEFGAATGLTWRRVEPG